MVCTSLNLVRLGNKDVRIIISMTGTKTEPQALIVFQNMDSEKNANCSSVPVSKKTVKYSQSRDIALTFSNPDSINTVISALKKARKATFGENNLADVYLS